MSPLTSYKVKNHTLKKPILVFDGDCYFCRAWIGHWKRMTGEKVTYAPFQEVQSTYPEIPLREFQKSVQFITTSGDVVSGAEAVFLSLKGTSQGNICHWLYKKIPGFKPLSEFIYWVVAKNRPVFSFLTRLLWGSHLEPPNFSIARWIFLRALGLTYIIAFVSFWVQAMGLIGPEGIYPIEKLLDIVTERFGISRYVMFPTIFWIDGSRLAIHIICGLGFIFGCLLMAGFFQTLALLFLWALYLSVVTVARDFLWFQWDILLLEIGFLSIFLAPLQLKPNIGREGPPSKIVLFLLYWLLFRLMFSSGMVKLMSGDVTWLNLEALNFHYETQPLPTWTSWYMHHLPKAFHMFSVGVMFIIEILCPFLIFGPRRIRYMAFATLVPLQIMILATGNYAFFNLLSILLCLLLLDNSLWPKKIHNKFDHQKKWSSDFPSWQWPRFITWGIAFVALISTSFLMTARFGWKIPWPRAVLSGVQVLQPFHSFNSYGLFAVMTTSRPEIIVEGSLDSVEWKSYEFKYKPGKLDQRPRFVAPHQPRLDWQMWFAALGNYQQNQWFVNFCLRLLQGSPDVVALLEHNPFPESPPKYIRARMYDYHFSKKNLKNETGQWWTKDNPRMYLPAISLRSN